MDSIKTVGVVQFFNNKKGWGLITDKDNKTYFIHHSDISDEKFNPINKPPKFRTLSPQQLVSFNVHVTNNIFESA